MALSTSLRGGSATVAWPAPALDLAENAFRPQASWLTPVTPRALVVHSGAVDALAEVNSRAVTAVASCRIAFILPDCSPCAPVWARENGRRRCRCFALSRQQIADQVLCEMLAKLFGSPASARGINSSPARAIVPKHAPSVRRTVRPRAADRRAEPACRARRPLQRGTCAGRDDAENVQGSPPENPGVGGPPEGQVVSSARPGQQTEVDERAWRWPPLPCSAG